MDHIVCSLGNRLQGINQKAESFIIAMGGFLILLFLSGVFLDVASRVLGFTISWMQEITTFIFVWAVFLGASIIFKQGALYTIDIFPKTLPVGILKLVSVTIICIEAICIFMVLKYGLEIAVMGIGRVSQPSGIRIVYAFASIPISAAFMVLFLAEIVLNLFIKQDGK